MKLTLLSDTHTKHNLYTSDLKGGDLLIHAGDLSSMGYKQEISNFCKWYDGIPNYNSKIFIAGNHDWGFQTESEETMEIVNSYKDIDYLQDQMIEVDDVKIWGSPWQPEFFNWAFNAKRGDDIKQHWDKIPDGIDILVTHGPAYGYLDKVMGKGLPLGCEDLIVAIQRVKPKIHICGHIHSGRGYTFDGTTHYFNASVLDEKYKFGGEPFQIDWNPQTNEITFL